jgi:hypothetical protein
MNLLKFDHRRSRKARPSLESLTERISPSSLHAGAVAAAALRIERREAALERRIERQDRKIAAHERLIARDEARLERLHAKVDAKAQSAMTSTAHVATAATSSAHSAAITPAVTPLQPIIPVTPPAPGGPGTGTGTGTSGTPQAVTAPLPVNVSTQLGTVYNEYEQWVANGSQGNFTSSEAGQIEIQGTNVEISVHDSNPADFSALGSELQTAGMQVVDADATSGNYVGWLPIAQLPTVAQLPQALNVNPIFIPILNLN